jgi:hypothetical protein
MVDSGTDEVIQENADITCRQERKADNKRKEEKIIVITLEQKKKNR